MSRGVFLVYRHFRFFPPDSYRDRTEKLSPLEPMVLSRYFGMGVPTSAGIKSGRCQILKKKPFSSNVEGFSSFIAFLFYAVRFSDIKK